ncbi:hypothetical protein DL96DRAFT_1615389 [Flagelloscypha sp. PMI_526]|nr:hypothetical protein DL96DRAFT_1615389 [Flagelloscypha sp. PMI_526]
MTSYSPDSVETTTMGSSSLASDTSTISHDYQQGVGRSLYGIMRSADAFQKGRARQILFKRTKATGLEGSEDSGARLASSKPFSISPTRTYSVPPSSRQRIAAKISSRSEETQTNLPSHSSKITEDFEWLNSKPWRPPSPTGTLLSTRAILNFPLTKSPSHSPAQSIRPARQSKDLPKAPLASRVTASSKSPTTPRAEGNEESTTGTLDSLMKEEVVGATLSPGGMCLDPQNPTWDDVHELLEETISLHVHSLGGRHSLVNLILEGTLVDILEPLRRPRLQLFLDRGWYFRKRGYVISIFFNFSFFALLWHLFVRQGLLVPTRHRNLD